MSGPDRLDAEWRARHPLPPIVTGLDKNERGRVLIVGGSRFVPGAVALTAEAALRVGGGKVQIATIAEAALAIGLAFPEAAVIALPTDDEGEIDGAAADLIAKHAAHCDSLVIGPGMAECAHSCGLIDTACRAMPEAARLILDAGALTACRNRAALQGANRLDMVMTPHHGELASLLDIDRDKIADDPEAAAARAAQLLGVTVALKDCRTLIVEPSGAALAFEGGAAGLGTAGSGDVLAGVIGGLAARGLPGAQAAAWGVWLHAEAGRQAGADIGTLGFLARELLPRLPAIVARASG
ncbi:NAD(P)H-hydrate dehydratase [Sphingomonas sp. 1P06PA]|uniref:NAD(P)H-hydrate dehydratase n=1 Tax=Sphingomonas sp. 1P06PA TaxID=554121 RepID=UPI0039A60E36